MCVIRKECDCCKGQGYHHTCHGSEKCERCDGNGSIEMPCPNGCEPRNDNQWRHNS